MNVPDVSLGVDGLGGDIEGAVLDVMTHAGHHLVAERLDVHQRAAIGELEETVSLVHHLVTDVEVVMGKAGVELEYLEDGFDIVAFDAHDLAKTVAVDRARPPPFLDGQPLHFLHPVRDADGRTHRAVENVDGLRVLAHQPNQRLSRQIFVSEIGNELTGIVGEAAAHRHGVGLHANGLIDVAGSHVSTLHSRHMSKSSRDRGSRPGVSESEDRR